MTDERDPLEDAPDPTADTPEAEPEDTAEDGDSGQTDWETRYKEAQKVISRQGTELSLLRRGDSDEDESDEDAADEDDSDEAGDGAPDPYLRRLESQSWSLAEAQYGEEAVGAYEAAYRILDRAETPADYIAAFEAYHEIRSGKTPAVDEKPTDGKKRTRQDSVQPRVDTNRDGSPDSDDKLAEARKSGSLGDFTSAAAARLGFGSSKR